MGKACLKSLIHSQILCNYPNYLGEGNIPFNDNNTICTLKHMLLNRIRRLQTRHLFVEHYMHVFRYNISLD